MTHSSTETFGELLSTFFDQIGESGIDWEVIGIVAVPAGYYFGALFGFLALMKDEVGSIVGFIVIGMWFFVLLCGTLVLFIWLLIKMSVFEAIEGNNRKETIFAYVSFTFFALMVNVFAGFSILTYRLLFN